MAAPKETAGQAPVLPKVWETNFGERLSHLTEAASSCPPSILRLSACCPSTGGVPWRQSADRTSMPSGDRSREAMAPRSTLARDLTNAELPRNARVALEEFARLLAQVRLPPLSRFILFGSYARGDYREDSDLDVAVVFEGAPPSPGPRLTETNELLVDPADAVLEAESMPLSPSAVWETELGDGTSLPEWPRQQITKSSA